MLLMGILVIAMFAGVSMAHDRDQDRLSLRDGSCGDCFDFFKVDGYCDWCGYDLVDDEDGDCDPPQDGSGEQNGYGEPKGDGDQEGDGEQNRNGQNR